MNDIKNIMLLSGLKYLAMIKKCNMQNYSIFYKDNLLYAYFEYTGNDFAADMAKMAADAEDTGMVVGNGAHAGAGSYP